MSAVVNRFQEAFGSPQEHVRGKVRDHLHEYVQAFIRAAPFVVLSSADAEGHCDASPKGGRPGFVKVVDERTLLLPDVAGNRLFQSYANIDTNAEVGLLFVIPGVGDIVRVNGTAKIVTRAELQALGSSLAVFDPDDNAKHLQGLLVTVREAYGHCPRAVRFARLWDTEVIQANGDSPPVPRRPRGV